ATTVQQRPSLYTFAPSPDVQCTDSFRAVELMRAQAEQVGAVCVHSYPHFAGCVGGVAKKQGLVLIGNLSDTLYRMKHPGFIVGMHQRNQYGICTDGGFQ